jgi:CIC family chloride channel protein
MPHILTSLHARVEDLRRREDQLALLLSLVIGALVSLVIIAFVLLTGRMAARIYPAGGAEWRRLVIPVAGAFVSGILLYHFFPDARGSGIPQTRVAIFINNGRITLRTVIGKFVCCSMALASGIALGREGPSVHIGSGIASVISRRLGLSTEQVRWLVPVGASAALAAAFNTPIAGVLFSLEEIMGDLHAPILGSVVLSSVTSWMMLHLVLGDEPLFHVAGYHLVSSWELIVYAVLGVAGGVGSVAFVRLVLGLRKWFLSLPHATRWIQPVAGGLTVGVLGYFVPQVLGVGYGEVERVLGGDVVLRVALLLFALKIIATAVCYASGNSGGIFGPSLFIGAMLGAAVGQIAHTALPTITADPGAYALVGMGTAFAGIIRTPLTSVIMIFEVTRDYTIIVPLMISNLMAFYVSKRLQHEPIYEALALQDGIHLPNGMFREHARRLLVSSAMREAPESAAELMKQSEEGGSVVHVHPDHPLGHALALMGSERRAVLPVVSRSDVRQMVGVVTLDDVLDAFGVQSRSELGLGEDDE